MEFPGKILLFGEYGILLNSMALSLPFTRYSGCFSFAKGSGSLNQLTKNASAVELNKLLSYLESGKNRFGYLDLVRFEADLKNGLYFDSTIPHGSGLGSSGALTAALYDRYLNTADRNTQDTRKHLASIESCFHGQSSGIDPLTSYLKKPVLLENPTSIGRTADLSLFFDSFTIFLVNTRYKARTSDLVAEFMSDYQHPHYRKAIDDQYIPLISRTIGALIAGDVRLFELLMKSVSLFQLNYFGKMIPAEMKDHFKQGIEQEDFYLKLCGSGGGGYLLAITRDRSVTETYMNLNRLDYSVVDQTEISNYQTDSFYKHLNI
jgi:mevalonate kinase